MSFAASAQDFRKSCEVVQGGSIKVRNVSGDALVRRLISR